MIQVGADERVAKYLMNETVRDALNELLEYEKRDGSNPLRIITRKTAAEIVAEGRQ